MFDKTVDTDVEYLAECLKRRNFVVLTGAGISTSSGIPDYRDSEGVRRGRQPMMFQEFLDSEQARRRYWARAMLGWPRVRAAFANPAHEALATLESKGLVGRLITQNVDTLHSQAGSEDVVELHGSLHWVLCLDCHQRTERDQIQLMLMTHNPWLADVDAVQAPDGDSLLDPTFEAGFELPHCPHCHGTRMKPDVVFFGENVAPPTAAKAMARVQNAEGLLVVGSSLMAFSAFRLCRAMAEQGKPLIAINLGKTRADELLESKIQQPCELLLPRLVKHLSDGQ